MTPLMLHHLRDTPICDSTCARKVYIEVFVCCSSLLIKIKGGKRKL